MYTVLELFYYRTHFLLVSPSEREVATDDPGCEM